MNPDHPIQVQTPLGCLLLYSCMLVLSLPLGAQCPQLIWSDEFDGSTLDPTRWTHQLGDGCDINLCGWGNNELQWYQTQNAVVEDGLLKIIAKQEQAGSKSYTSARIRSRNKGDWTYGRFEASIKLPVGRGIWPAFWMMPTDEVYGSWPQSGEIDIMEMIGQEPEVVHGTIHYGPAWPNNRSTGGQYRLNSGIFDDDFHEFAVEWDSFEIRWLVDDFLYSIKTKSDLAPFPWPFDQNFHFLLNMAVGGNWPGNPDGSTNFPQTMSVEYVRVYSDFAPYIIGNRRVAFQAMGERYTIVNAPDSAEFVWTVPSGTSIVSGATSNEIVVNWGSQGGVLAVSINDECGASEIELEVLVEPEIIRAFSLENFDDPARMVFDHSTGTLTENVDNPDLNEVNASALVGRYARDGSQQFDVLAYDIADLGDASLFREKEKKFYIDIFTDAPVGTLILLQLENSRQTTPNNC